MISKKKKIYLIAICVAIVMGISVIAIVITSTINANKYLNRYEWIEMLGEEVGMKEYSISEPYFSDVSQEEEYFKYIQSAVEWGVLEEAKQYKGEQKVKGEFVALTVMKTVHPQKIKIYLDSDEEVSDDMYLDVAIDLEIISKKQLKKKLTRDEAETVLARFREVYFNELWLKDYEKVIYNKNVVELNKEDVLYGNQEGTQIIVSNESLQDIDIGKIVVYDYGNTGLKYAGKIVSVSEDGSIELSNDITLEEVFESFTLSDVEELDFNDIIQYYGLEQEVSGSNNLLYQKPNEYYLDAKIYSSETTSKGFKLKVSSDGEGEVSLEITDNNTGVSYELPINDASEVLSKCSVEIDIDKIYYGAQVDCSLSGGVKYVDVAIDSHATITGEMTALEAEKKISLFKTPAPLGTGYVGVDVEIFLVLSVDGTISVSAEIPIETSVYYEKGKGLREFDVDVSVDKPTFEGNCSAGVAIRLEPTLVVLGFIDVIDIQADMGIEANANVKSRPNSQICTDISVSFPVLSVSVCGDDEADTVIGLLGLSAEWDFITAEDAPIKFGMHFECLPDGKTQFVDKCTYGNDEVDEDKELDYIGDKEEQETGNSSAKLYDFSHLYGTPVRIDIKAYETLGEYYEPDEFDLIGGGGYSADVNITDDGTGYLIEMMYIEYILAISPVKYNQFITKAVGEEYTIRDDEYWVYSLTEETKLTCMGENFTLVSYIVSPQGGGHCTFIGDDGENYYIGNDLSCSMDMYTGLPYFSISQEDGDVVRQINFDEGAFLKLPYGTELDSRFETCVNNSPDMSPGEPGGFYNLQLDDEGNIVKISGY